MLDSEGLVRLPQLGYRECMGTNNADALVIKVCSSSSDTMLWSWDRTSKQFTLRGTSRCLTLMEVSTAKSPYSLQVLPCTEDKAEMQRWDWK